MLEELHQILELVKGLPELVMWVLAGLLFYKVCLLGSWFGVSKLLITKIYDWAVKPTEKIIKYDLDGFFITRDGTLDNFKKLIGEMRNTKTGIPTPYIHSGDVEWLRSAIAEKKARESKPPADMK